MCLGIPGQVIAVRGEVAVVDFWGVLREVKIDAAGPTIAPGDYVLNHVGYVVRRIPAEAVADTLALYEVILTEAGEDPLATGVFDSCATETRS
jgi:hydrogenase expression/formation protein HypC